MKKQLEIEKKLFFSRQIQTENIVDTYHVNQKYASITNFMYNATKKTLSKYIYIRV